MSKGVLAAFLPIYLVVAVILSPLLHVVIPHNDTHTVAQYVSECETVFGYGHCDENHFRPVDGGHDKTVWSFVHSLLAHVNKKAVAADAGFVLICFVLAAFAFAQRFSISTRTKPDHYERALSAGVFAFRRFR